jgi:hypothetical protein
MTFRNTVIAVLLAMTVVSVSWAGQINRYWTVTFDERMRVETWDNAMSLDETAADSRTYTRNRTRLGATWSPLPNATFGLRLGNEFRYCLAPKNIDFNLNEIFVDQLCVKAILFEREQRGLTLTIGRQDITLGEGLIVMDGDPLDGSRSGYFNAARLDWTIRPKHLLTAFVSHLEETDSYLPIIHDQHQALVEQPETGIGLRYQGTWYRKEIQGFFVHKASRSNASIPFNSTVNTIGGKILLGVGSVIAIHNVTLEAEYQFGKRGNADRRAFGGHGYFSYFPDWPAPLPTSFKAGFIYLSGDNPKTNDWEGWDPMFGRWPKWSDSYIYTQIKEDAVAWWTNLASIYAEALFGLTPAVELKFAYHHLMAPQEAEASSDFPGGTGATRGDLFIGKLTYKFDQRWSGHLQWEGFTPGDYYFDGADSYAWIRAELMYQY